MPPKKYAFSNFPKNTNTNTNSNNNIKYKKGLGIQYNQEFEKGESEWLIIVESPSKITKIEYFLGSRYRCIASKGHIRTIDGLKSIDKKNGFQPKFSIIPEKKKHVDTMHSIIRQYPPDKIILATDNDREGEAIAWHVCDEFGLSVESTQRIFFQEITESAILSAVQNPGKIQMNLVDSQKKRQVLDIIVGFKISPVLWKYINHEITGSSSENLSAGRCQTPALRLIYDNECSRVLENSESKTTATRYRTVAHFFTYPVAQNIPFVLSSEFDTSEKVQEFLNKSMEFKYELVLRTTGSLNKIEKPPTPFNTSSMLQSASQALNLSPNETMECAQFLYQSGYITYMRTENTKYSRTFIDSVFTYITKTWSDSYIGNASVLENIHSQNPHEAIRVTNIELSSIPTSTSENKNAVKLYAMIWKRTLESCMSLYTAKTVDVYISAPCEPCDNEITYTYRLEIPVSFGWKLATMKPGEDTVLSNAAAGLLLVFQTCIKNKTKFTYNFIKCSPIIAQSHSYYTESSLIQKLDDLGIGRPSTFAHIVKTIQDRGYVKKTNFEGNIVKYDEYVLENARISRTEREFVAGKMKDKLVIQPLGKSIVEFLLLYFESLFSYEYTKNMEWRLDKIANPGPESEQCEYESRNICGECYSEIKSMICEMNKIYGVEYSLGDKYTFLFARFGPVIKHTMDENGEPEYISVRKNMKIDMDRMRDGGYKLQELMEDQKSKSEIEIEPIGTWNGEPVFIKSGKYGKYMECGKIKKNISEILDFDVGGGSREPGDSQKEEINPMKKTTKTTKTKKTDNPDKSITMSEISVFLDGMNDKPGPDVLRTLNEEFSVRKGKYGAYVYYKRADMKCPSFLNIKNFTEGYLHCDENLLLEWLYTTYNLPKNSKTPKIEK